MSALAPGLSIYYSKGPHDIPQNSIPGGAGPFCGQTYVGFAQHGNESMPAKIVPEYRAAYYPFDSKEHTTEKLMFLVLKPGYSYEWIPQANGNVPPNAAKLGRSLAGENFFVGRGVVNNEKCIGKISKNQRCCYVPYGGDELVRQNYDVLVIKQIARSTPVHSKPSIFNISDTQDGFSSTKCDFSLTEQPRSTPAKQNPGTSMYNSSSLYDLPQKNMSGPYLIAPPQKNQETCWCCCCGFTSEE